MYLKLSPHTPLDSYTFHSRLLNSPRVLHILEKDVRDGYVVIPQESGAATGL